MERIVVTVDASELRVALYVGPPGEGTLLLSFPVQRSQGADLNLFDASNENLISSRSRSTVCSLGSQLISCTQGVFVSKVTHEDGRITTVTSTVWMSPDVLGSGLARFQIKDDETALWSMDTVAYGSAGKTLWSE